MLFRSWGKPPLQVLPEALGEAAPCWGHSILVGDTYQAPWTEADEAATELTAAERRAQRKAAREAAREENNKTAVAEPEVTVEVVNPGFNGNDMQNADFGTMQTPFAGGFGMMPMPPFGGFPGFGMTPQTDTEGFSGFGGMPTTDANGFPGFGAMPTTDAEGFNGFGATPDAGENTFNGFGAGFGNF